MNKVAGIVSIGAVAALSGALLVFQLAQPRIFMVMARDGLLPRWFEKVGPRGTPVNATWVTGVLVLLPAGLMNIDEVVELTNIGTLFAFVLVSAGVLILRVKRPDAPRKFRTPLVWFSAPAGILFCLWLALGLPRTTWERFVIWLVIGLFLYFLYSVRHSRLSNAAGDRCGRAPETKTPGTGVPGAPFISKEGLLRGLVAGVRALRDLVEVGHAVAVRVLLLDRGEVVLAVLLRLREVGAVGVVLVVSVLLRQRHRVARRTLGVHGLGVRILLLERLLDVHRGEHARAETERGEKGENGNRRLLHGSSLRSRI